MGMGTSGKVGHLTGIRTDGSMGVGQGGERMGCGHRGGDT